MRINFKVKLIVIEGVSIFGSVFKYYLCGLIIIYRTCGPKTLEDWVAYIKKFGPNPCALSSSKPQSKFTTAWLGYIFQLGVNMTWAAYGPHSLDTMVHEIQHSVANSTFQVLPGCFFEGVTSKGARAADEEIPHGRQFFNSTSLESMIRRRNYIDPRSRNHSTFGYHWHNQWWNKVEDSSMANAAEKLYCELLNIKLKWVRKNAVFTPNLEVPDIC